MIKKIFFGIALIAISASLFFWRMNFSQKEKAVVADIDQNLQETVFIQNKEALQEIDKIENNLEVVKDEKNQSVQTGKIKVPFTSQAPSGNWNDQHFQNGCEEASILMAMKWIHGEVFSSPAEVEKEIKNISKFEDNILGNSVDASLDDIGIILSRYYNFKNYTIKKNITIKDLKNELSSGNILLIPAFGRALKNPNYTQPGPITHMLVVTKYDAVSKKFITNDPGTKRGEGYQYDEKVLFDAIWEYSSKGDHLNSPKVENMKKGMIIIRPKSL